MKNSETLANVGKNTGEMLRNTGTKMRAVGNLGVKASIVGEAAIIGKNIGIAPEISEAIANTTDKLPNVLEISTELPGIGDAIDYILTHYPAAQDIATDAHNMANIGVYGGIFSLLYLLGKYGLLGKKGRFEAGTSSVVWTALSVGFLSEMLDALQGNGRDVMRWALPFYDSIPFAGENGENLINPEFRKNYYAAIAGIISAVSTFFAGKNITRLIRGIPKKKERK